jgi:diamine N-acetyltransferase
VTPTIELRELRSSSDRSSVLGLRLAPGQERFVSDAADSLAEADEEQRAMPRAWAVHDEASGEVVGFVMISDGIPAETLERDEDLIGPYYLWKLFVDADHQRQGYGTAILDAVVGYLRDRPGADVLYTSCGQGDGTPQPFYERYGFVPTGEIKWDEVVLRLDLTGKDR